MNTPACVQIKHARPFNEESNLVIFVNVLVEELCSQLLALGIVGQHADDIKALVSAFFSEPANVRVIGSQ